MEECLVHYDVEIYAYCIMNNHLHLLIKSELEELSRFMAKVLATYAQYYNYKNDRIGYVFQDRYKSECVENERYYWSCLRYIHLNPLHANIVKNATRYKYSSMSEYTTQKTRLLHPKALKFWKNRFDSMESFEIFHQGTDKEIFKDTNEDTLLQRKRIAKHIIKRIAKEWNTTELEVFETPKLRGIYRKKLEKILSVSRKECQEIMDYTKQILKEAQL